MFHQLKDEFKDTFNADAKASEFREYVRFSFFICCIIPLPLCKQVGPCLRSFRHQHYGQIRTKFMKYIGISDWSEKSHEELAALIQQAFEDLSTDERTVCEEVAVQCYPSPNSCQKAIVHAVLSPIINGRDLEKHKWDQKCLQVSSLFLFNTLSDKTLTKRREGLSKQVIAESAKQATLNCVTK